MRRLGTIALLAAVLAAGPALAASKGGEEEKKTGPGSSYIQLPVVTATVIRPTGHRGALTLETGLDVPDAKLRQRAEMAQPRLRAAYFQVLNAYTRSLTPGDVPDADRLARELQRETDRVLGAKGARLLLGTMLMN